jgi:hypothetical protein
MKLDVISPKITRSAEFKEEFFGIGDVSVLLDILRSKIYANPAKTICQEIMSNARDAHREVNKADVPIEVKIPTSLDHTFYVRDFGPGITPERMSEIFIKYGNSSKRTDNGQTGGFGLGAKTPFAYTDTFTIVSITPQHIFENKDEEDNILSIHENCMVRRQYIAYIDESRIGRMACVSSELTDEPQGTTVSITVKPVDFDNFKHWVRFVSQYWKVRPIIKGCPEWEWTYINKEVEGTNWFLEKIENNYSNDNKFPQAIVDGIVYPISQKGLNVDYGTTNYKLFQFPLRLIFNTGEIPLTANREEIDYAKTSTLKVIKDRFDIVAKELSDKLSKIVEGAKNLWDAKVLWKKFNNNYYSVVKNVRWNNIEVSYNDFPVRNYGITVFRFNRELGSIKRKETNIIEFLDNTLIFEEDTGVKVPTKERAYTLFEQDKTLQRIYVIVFDDDPTKAKNSLDSIEKEQHYSFLNVEKYSSVAKTKIPKMNVGTSGSNGPICKVLKYNPSTYHYTKSEYWRDSTEDLVKGTGYYVELLNRTVVFNSPDGIERNMDNSCITDVLGLLKIDKLYGISRRFVKKAGPGWIKLVDHLYSVLDTLEKDKDVVEYKNEKDCLDETISVRFKYLKDTLTSTKMESLIEEKDGIYHRYVAFSDKLWKVKEKLNKIIKINYCLRRDQKTSGVADITKSKIVPLANEFSKTYPLVEAINKSNYYYTDAVQIEELAFYINCVDKREKDKKKVAKP